MLKMFWHFLKLPVIRRNKNRKLWKKYTLPTISYFDMRWILMASWGRRPWFYESVMKSASMMSGAKGFIQTMQHLHSESFAYKLKLETSWIVEPANHRMSKGKTQRNIFRRVGNNGWRTGIDSWWCIRMETGRCHWKEFDDQKISGK